MEIKKLLKVLPALLLLSALLSCSKEIGWGVLLWTIEEPAIPSGTVLPVYMRSNIEEQWIAGIPGENPGGQQKLVEIPLSHLELFRTRGAALRQASANAEYAITYAEVLQDGLPIRDKPENGARRVYRLKEGEVIKILEKAEGVEAVGASGAPLEGGWFVVLTESGSTGYCFSNRLRFFEHTRGPLVVFKPEISGDDPDLDFILSRPWYPESYGAMLSSGSLDTEALAKHWGFIPGADTGKAKITLPDLAIDFPYRKISRAGERAWIFEGSPLLLTFQGEPGAENARLTVQYDDETGLTHSAVFVNLPFSVDMIISREMSRRQTLYQELFVRGPSYYSPNYGALTLSSDRRFSWDEMGNLPPGMFPPSALGSGIIDMGIYLPADLVNRYTGALSMKLDAVNGEGPFLTFLYTLDNQGLKLEYVPRENLNGPAVVRRDSSALVIYFSAE
ncbi:MAG: SH3 domain-containing protein [Treponema sp.]|nr:SH3 domain-containing protein [Treponema sp.]